MPISTDGFYQQLGSRIRDARKAVGLTQAELADAAGLTRASVANIEAGRQKVLVHHLVSIAATTESSVASLLPGSESLGVDMERVRRSLPEDQSGFVTAVLERARRSHG